MLLLSAGQLIPTSSKNFCVWTTNCQCYKSYA